MLSLRTYRTFTFSCYGISYIFYKKEILILFPQVGSHVSCCMTVILYGLTKQHITMWLCKQKAVSLPYILLIFFYCRKYLEEKTKMA